MLRDWIERRQPEVAAGLAVTAVALLSWAPAELGDVWMYAATGRVIMDTHAIPRTDPFSWTMGGQAWQSNAWGWGVVLWGLYSAFGLAGIAVVKPLLVCACAIATWWAARTLGARRVPCAVAAVVAAVGTVPWVSERPQMASYVLFPLLIGLGARAVRDDRLAPGWFAATLAVVVLWVNIHSFALFGVAVLVLFCATSAVGAWWRTRRLRSVWPASLVAVAAAAATLANPWGIGLLRHSLDVRDVSRATVSEWYPVTRSGALGVVVVVAVAAVAIVVVWSRGWRRPELLVPLAFVAYQALDAVRGAPFLAIAAAMLCAPMVPVVRAAWLTERARLAVVGGLAAVVVAGVLAVPRIAATGDPGRHVPVDAAAALPTGCQLRNDYRLGGWVIFERPDVPVSSDGRNDLYRIAGYDQNEWFETAAGAAAASSQLRAEGTDCVLAMADSPLPAALEADGWTVVGRDAEGVALVDGNSSGAGPASN